MNRLDEMFGALAHKYDGAIQSDQARLTVYEDGVYLIRDVWNDQAARDGGAGMLRNCEYAVATLDSASNGYNVEWKPCVEGVLLVDIEPLLDIMELVRINAEFWPAAESEAV